MDDLTRIYSYIPSISAEMGFALIDDIRNGDLVPDPIPNGGGAYDEKGFHEGFVQFLVSDLSRAIMEDMRDTEYMYEWD